MNQHFVPQYYLKNFADSNQRVYVFDIKSKALLSPKAIPVSKIGFKKDFYNIPPMLISIFCDIKTTDPRFIDDLIEKYNERINAPFIKSFQELGKTITNSQFNLEVVSAIQNSALYDFLLIQLCRTPRFRNVFNSIADDVQLKLKEINEKSNDDNKIRPELLEKSFILAIAHNIFVLAALLETDSFKAHKTKISLKSEYQFLISPIKDFINRLDNSYKIMLVTKGAKTFKTSDNPVHIESIGGALDSFKFVYIPITNRCSFIFLNPLMFPLQKYRNRTVDILDDSSFEKIDNLNILMLRNSERFIYSENDNFHKIKLFVEKKISSRLII